MGCCFQVRGRAGRGRVMRALVVEDERLLRQVVCEYLQEEGFVVSTAADGQEALDLVRRDRGIDVVVLDDEMPRLRGRDLLSVLRAEGHGVAVVLVSGSLTLGPEECARLGVGPVIRKPVKLAALLQAIGEAVRERSSS